MKTPDFENCQIWVNETGRITNCSQSFTLWIGLNKMEVKGLSLYDLFCSLEISWREILSEDFSTHDCEYFLPIVDENKSLSIGIYLTCMTSERCSVISISPALAPHNSLKNAYMGDLMNSPQAFASTLIRLQKAESRLADYVSNFPGIFFTQRNDFTFSYLSSGIQKLFPDEHKEFSRDGGLFISKIFEQDREHFHHMLARNATSKETFSFSYRVELQPSAQLIYLLDVRTPVITSSNKLLGYDGVFIDITRQAIAEHRLSNSVWREGLATLTNGLVHDFSNLMAGIYSISELYHNMMEKDDPMANGLGQIRKSTMQAQKLVRRIIDLHRDKPATRTVHDIRLLLKDQMDLIEIIIPRSAKIVTDFGRTPIPAYLEETGFRQVILNLAINARDAISRGGRIKIAVRPVKVGDTIMRDAWGGERLARFNGAEISFNDNGMGIPESTAPYLFDPFFTTKESSNGSGFGLYNSKLFIEDHKGDIGFASKEGTGTTFYLFLPMANLENDFGQETKTSKRARRESTRNRISRK
jgi:signal transduction histidine kinase